MRQENILQNIRMVLIDPVKFFEKHKTKNWMELVKLVAILEVVPTIIFTIFLNVRPFIFRHMFGLGIFCLPLIYLILFVTGIFGLLIGSIILHMGVYIIGKHGLIKTATVNTYSYVPLLLFFWIPVINLIIPVWTIALQIIGIAKQHKVEYVSAILAFIYSSIILLIIFGVVVLSLSSILFPFLMALLPARI
ncbi:MAG: YIP1 family protein [Candidatus Parvarchaeota archaeon]|nr:YIP1 family protein [Candidatus Jingweiarchaeum tengchongense]MCW1298317.1 YIP1 family protein [Candidatus Jingweiarchaeum tengchongense]MCW1300408.1 YIP1 family protein [Candidatus Jingweiarchaeum tengchongense]MCW1304747.1 YIP1 family protein [Candidatus Jingweiarchaeum tengchongense]MCW1305337.1 YIP1 family protein [Candidatus Jingweiarchaeum tengchongense]